MLIVLPIVSICILIVNLLVKYKHNNWSNSTTLVTFFSQKRSIIGIWSGVGYYQLVILVITQAGQPVIECPQAAVVGGN
jgi:hypothetical protein